MATRTKPIVSAAALASVAAIAVASPAITPSLNLPSPHALAAAKVQLANFSDVLSIPAAEWTNILFSNTGWGGKLSGDTYGPDWAEPQDQFLQAGYVNPWATYCDAGCYQSGPTGVAYLFFDALFNGDGLGYDQSDQWSIGLMNYLWEPNSVFILGGGSSPNLQFVSEGWSAASWYILQGTLGQAIPELTVPLAAAYWGPTNVSVFYNLGLSVTAALVSQVPAVGPFIGNSILAYLGDLEIPDSGGQTYQYGLSGALNYWVDIATGAVPFPSASTEAGAGAALVAATPAAASSEAPAADVKESTPAADAPESTPAGDAPESTPAEDLKESTPASDAPESTPAEDVKESTPAADTPESTPAADTPAADALEDTPAMTETESVDLSDVLDVKDSRVADGSDPAPTEAAPKRPIRDAVEKVGKRITSAINGAKAAKAAKAGAADSAD